MVFKITDDCINCGVCKAECPADAIFPPGENWRNLLDKNFLYTAAPGYRDSYYSDKYFYIVDELCSNCSNEQDGPRCVMTCPLGCIFSDNSKKNIKQFYQGRNSIYESLSSTNKLIRYKYAAKEILP